MIFLFTRIRTFAIFELLDSHHFVRYFHFSAMAAAVHNLLESSHINFLPTKPIDCDPLLSLFDHWGVKFFESRNYLVFVATPVMIEKVILTSQELSISISSSRSNSTQKLSFEKTSDNLFANITPSTQDTFLELLIARGDICSRSDILWTPALEVIFLDPGLHIFSSIQIFMLKQTTIKTDSIT